MENKYYTPDVSEFYIGFEYEHAATKGEINHFKQEVILHRYQHYTYPEKYPITSWYKCTFTTERLSFLNENTIKIFLERKWLRVKYLDKEDIESLGFKQKKIPWQFTNGCFNLIKRNEDNQYIIEDIRHADQVFVGTIMNKSEFKKLLKQLDIL